MKFLRPWISKVWRSWIGQLALMFAIISPLRSSVVDWNWVPTGSMKPTILEGDLMLVNKLAYDLKVPFTTCRLADWGNPARGDVAVFFSPTDGTRLVKRVVGLPGDTVAMRNDILYINEEAQDYTLVDVEDFSHVVERTHRPVLALENLKGIRHYVMTLPDLPSVRNFGPYTIPEGTYFMLGDSRNNSLDSRFFGPVPEKLIVGRTSRILASFDPGIFFLPRLSRFFASLKPDEEA